MPTSPDSSPASPLLRRLIKMRSVISPRDASLVTPWGIPLRSGEKIARPRPASPLRHQETHRQRACSARLGGLTFRTRPSILGVGSPISSHLSPLRTPASVSVRCRAETAAASVAWFASPPSSHLGARRRRSSSMSSWQYTSKGGPFRTSIR